MMSWDNDWSAWWILMPLVMVGFWAAVIWVVVILVRGQQGSAPDLARPTRPEDILGERYARGEIDEHEYRRRIDTLRGATHVGEHR